MSTYTQLKYYDDSYQFDDTARVLAVVPQENGKQAVILDQTIMYPQGGGQPYDTGTITQDDTVFIVTDVRYKDGQVYHIGHFTHGTLQSEDAAVHVDEPRRRLHARIHTAGHLVDDALYDLGYGMIPLKGYHFPDGPYVEYQNALSGDLVAIAQQVETKINALIATNFAVRSEIVHSIAELKGKCPYLPPHIPEGKPIRIIYASGDTKGQTCGGTHVKYLEEIGTVKIPRIKVKKGTTRVSYVVT
ncbi:hypothetical protein KBB08_02100 [Candidatus Gracilibacteria bacterium]|nr:hypothetical protein [Candidatus Gracilibacteria bacterium]